MSLPSGTKGGYRRAQPEGSPPAAPHHPSANVRRRARRWSGEPARPPQGLVPEHPVQVGPVSGGQRPVAGSGAMDAGAAR
jgi:hypothetical protein